MQVKFRHHAIAFAAISAVGAAHAQSSVTVFGTADIGVGRYNVSGGNGATAMTNSNINNSRLGFNGVEDLGGGMSASFWLETAINLDDGTSPGGFQRRSTVSLSGDLGELRLGRDFTPTFWNDVIFDPFGAAGIGTNVVSQARSSGTLPGRMPLVAGRGINNPTYVRTNNAIGYFLPPNLGGIYGQLQYALSESTVPGSMEGKYVAGRIGYRQGPLNVAIAAGKNTGANPTTVTSPTISTVNLAGSYNFGLATLMGEYSNEKYDAAGTINNHRGYLVGVTIPFSAGNILAAYSNAKFDLPGNPAASKIALGYVHSLSKRTALYGTYAYIDNKNGALLAVNNTVRGIENASSSGVEFGIRHNF